MHASWISYASRIIWHLLTKLKHQIRKNRICKKFYMTVTEYFFKRNFKFLQHLKLITRYQCRPCLKVNTQRFIYDQRRHHMNVYNTIFKSFWYQKLQYFHLAEFLTTPAIGEAWMKISIHVHMVNFDIMIMLCWRSVKFPLENTLWLQYKIIFRSYLF